MSKYRGNSFKEDLRIIRLSDAMIAHKQGADDVQKYTAQSRAIVAGIGSKAACGLWQSYGMQVYVQVLKVLLWRQASSFMDAAVFVKIVEMSILIFVSEYWSS